VYLDNGDKEYLYLKDKGFKNIRKLERISIPKGSITIWYETEYDKDGIRITDNFCIIITSNQNEKVEYEKPYLGDTCHLLSLLVNILGLKAYEIIVPMYTCKINPEKNEEFHKFIIDVLKGTEIFNKYIEKNDDYAGDENYIDMPEKEVNKISPGKQFAATTRYFYTKKSIIIGAMVLVRAHSYHDLHSEGVQYDDYINFCKFLEAMRYTSKYEEGFENIIKKFGEKYKTCV
jgi:hypothetical protein